MTNSDKRFWSPCDRANLRSASATVSVERLDSILFIQRVSLVTRIPHTRSNLAPLISIVQASMYATRDSNCASLWARCERYERRTEAALAQKGRGKTEVFHSVYNAIQNQSVSAFASITTVHCGACECTVFPRLDTHLRIVAPLQ